MSLIDPSTRWWNRWMWALPWACWGLALILSFVGSWGFTRTIDATEPVATMLALGASMISLLLLIGGAFAGVDDGKHKKPGGYAYFNVMVGYMIAMSLGFIVPSLLTGQDPPSIFYVFVMLGVAALGGGVWWRRRAQHTNTLADSVIRKGAKTTGVVTRARVWHSGTEGALAPSTRVTVKFTDKTGAARWSSHTVHGAKLQVGDQVRVTYVQELLDQKGGVVVSPR